ncbi:glycosyltransferase family 8 protein [Pedobacter heparinus]|uniref:glycosyltransferase family 8 protein n=1 Tax=Pedobacter heparinus TaxID=984 RepID=UPI002930216F|nr:glycosyltransferase family 8 protein [Pedobacter heparinus]
MKETISIVGVCGNHFAVLLAALLKSLELNHRTDENIDFYIIDDKISYKNKLKLNRSVDKKTINLIWLKMSDCIPKQFDLPKDKSTYPIKIYMKLFIPYFMPEHVEKVIFLDVDMIMLEDVSVLWNIDLNGHPIAAAQDQFIKEVGNWGGIQNYEDFNLTPDTKYFNTGLIVFDIKKWLNLNVTEKVLDCTNENQKFASFGDQYGLNAVLGKDWYQLDPLWNRYAYSEEERPFNIHFTGRKPIYKTYEYNEHYKELFYNYLYQTEWKNFKPIGETSRYLSKLNNILSKLRKMI